MKALIIACLAAVALAAGFHSVENKSTAVVHSNDISPVYHASKALIIRADEDPDVIYHKATCKGQKLLSATTSPRNVAANYIQPIDSPWIGPLVQSLATWGYSIETDSGPCVTRLESIREAVTKVEQTSATTSTTRMAQRYCAMRGAGCLQ